MGSHCPCELGQTYSMPLGITRIAILLLGLLGDPSRPRLQAMPPTMRVVGYLASWGVRSKGSEIASLPAGVLTHIYYAFALIGPDGSVILGDPCIDVGACGRVASLPSRPLGNFGELRRLKTRYPDVKLTISIGGWGGSARFSDAALTDASRQTFARTALDLFFRRWPGLFNGIDIDW